MGTKWHPTSVLSLHEVMTELDIVCEKGTTTRSNTTSSQTQAISFNWSNIAPKQDNFTGRVIKYEKQTCGKDKLRRTKITFLASHISLEIALDQSSNTLHGRRIMLVFLSSNYPLLQYVLL